MNIFEDTCHQRQTSYKDNTDCHHCRHSKYLIIEIEIANLKSNEPIDKLNVFALFMTWFDMTFT